ncbi:hypothetical protein [Methylocucumis oryzae]|uniref:Uncharacterized protein n=1 Tax=Methylocucumis oryzae TaxID=1632867 RepID=A0A0F3IRA2_9GAMM|nr:hypothetical protein [Methylocucumis oryzae]KJV08119.1 hypothetical protein VZ94_00250 [Methylocucumis oryzae]
MFKSLGIFIFLFLLSIELNVAVAENCGVVRLLSNKSSGVTVSDNHCEQADSVSLGAVFDLSPGARLWFKTQSESADAHQGICLNRSPAKIRLQVNQEKQPWVSPKLETCSQWQDNKLQCTEPKTHQPLLVCVLAALTEASQGFEDRTTSVKVRGLPALDEPNLAGFEAKLAAETIDVDSVVDTMQLDIDLCRSVNPSAKAIDLSWQVVDGVVTSVSPTPSQLSSREANDNYWLECLTSVVKKCNLSALS